MENLGGKCDPDHQKFCDGPLKPRTAYRLDLYRWLCSVALIGLVSSGYLIHLSFCRLVTALYNVLCVSLQIYGSIVHVPGS